MEYKEEINKRMHKRSGERETDKRKRKKGEIGKEEKGTVRMNRNEKKQLRNEREAGNQEIAR